jgi:hypothetical protein
MKIISLILLYSRLFFPSCNSPVSKDTSKAYISKPGNNDSLERTDSMKWYFYMANHDAKVYFLDTIKNYRNIEVNPLECDVSLEKIMNIGKDSMIYIFKFSHQNLYFSGLKPLHCFGISSYNNIISPKFNHVIMNSVDNGDSAKFYLNKWDSTFKKFLKNYKGKISPWLKNEAIRRNVLL